KDSESLMTQSYPEVENDLISTQAEEEMQWLQTFILGIRQIRGEMNIPPSKPLPCFVQNISNSDQHCLDAHSQVLSSLAKLEKISYLNVNDEAPESATALVGEMKILIPLAGLIDKDQEAARLNKEIEKLNKQRAQFAGKLNNEKFISGAPEAVVNKEKEKLTSVENAIADLSTQLEKIANL
ncbi:MAG: valine--tRNA ligase, partial [Candidatus Thioglobus sp.]